MNSPLSLASTALQAFGQKLEGVAANIANAGTDGDKKVKTPLREARNDGVETQEEHADNPRGPLSAGVEKGPAAQEPPTVNLEGEIPELITTVYGFRANLKTVKAQDEVLGHLLNALA